MASIDRIHRLLRLVELLQSGRVYNSTQLADITNVSRRTVFRDLNTLQDSGIQIRYDEGRQGYSIPGPVFLPTAEFTLDETLSLLILCHGLGDDTQGVPFQRGARSAALKLLSNLPSHLRDDVAELTHSVAVRLDAHNPLNHSQGSYDLLTRALRERRQVRIQYKSLTEWENISTVVSPYRVLFSRRSWYVIGRSSLHRSVRTFNIGRVLKSELLPSRYEIPPRFSLDRYLGNAWHLIKEPGRSQNVVVRFQKLVAHNVAEVRWHRTQRVVWNDDESMDFHATVDGLNEIMWWILGYGEQAEVLKPAKLRSMVREQVASMSKLYEQSSRKKTPSARASGESKPDSRRKRSRSTVSGTTKSVQGRVKKGKKSTRRRATAGSRRGGK